MSRINVSNLRSVSELSRGEMGGTVGGLLRRRFCFPTIRFVTVRGPFGIKIRVPRVVIVCR